MEISASGLGVIFQETIRKIRVSGLHNRKIRNGNRIEEIAQVDYVRRQHIRRKKASQAESQYNCPPWRQEGSADDIPSEVMGDINDVSNRDGIIKIVQTHHRDSRCNPVPNVSPRGAVRSESSFQDGSAEKQLRLDRRTKSRVQEKSESQD